MNSLQMIMMMVIGMIVTIFQFYYWQRQRRYYHHRHHHHRCRHYNKPLKEEEFLVCKGRFPCVNSHNNNCDNRNHEEYFAIDINLVRTRENIPLSRASAAADAATAAASCSALVAALPSIIIDGVTIRALEKEDASSWSSLRQLLRNSLISRWISTCAVTRTGRKADIGVS